MADVMEKTEAKTQTQNRSDWEEKLFNEPVIAPVIDIYEEENSYFLNVEMPGLNKDNIKIKVEDDNLLIMGDSDNQKDADKNYVYKESCSGNYFRKIKISDQIDSENIAASYENGQLKVELPKSEKAKPRKIEVK
jgi:HSP20 family protein